MTTNITYNNNCDVFLNIEHREYDKTFKCKILLNKYIDVFNDVLKRWDKYVEKSFEKSARVADIIQANYKIPYAAAADIAKSIAASKNIKRKK